MNKIKLLLVLLLLGTTITVNNCSHSHNEECGFNEMTNVECSHEHDDSCYEIDPNYWFDPDDPRA